ncbi:MAG: protein translocase subunit SecF [Actinomycetales bacterium]|nr:MAG: protein translocase subunit SecF [Actinomycetales bacterium]
MTRKQKIGLAHRLYTGDLSYDFVGRARLWLIISAVVVTASIAILLLKGLTLGIEFKGGADFQAPTKITDSSVGEMRSAIDDLKLPEMESVTVLTVGNNAVRVQTRSLNPEEVIEVRQAIAKQLNISSEEVAYSLIGASWGEQITKRGAMALVVFMALVMAMIWIYFRDWKMSVSAIVALFHDLVITIGVYALVGFTVTPATLIGALTILGYSLYDTVVVFDKVRENVSDLELRGKTYSEAANLAVNQVLIRSINTTIIGVLPVGALLIASFLFLPTGPLIDLGLALFVGMISGAYSSIFIATPLLAAFREREPDMVKHRQRLARRAKKQQEKEKVPVEVVVTSDSPKQPAAKSTEEQTGERHQVKHLSRAERKKK